MMYCPKCKYEYVQGTKVCNTCGSELVEQLPSMKQERKDPQYVELVTVFTSNNPGTIAVAKSLLEGEGIWYFAKGEALSNLLGYGNIGAYNVISKSIEIQVKSDDAEVATELLQELV